MSVVLPQTFLFILRFLRLHFATLDEASLFVAIAHLSLLSHMIHAIWVWLENWRVVVIVIVVQGAE
jgi:hypothetical protein